jgi:TRAP-type C4-dicarboxylate transport system permease small subunit
MYAIGRFLSFLSQSASLIGALCILLMMLHVTADVAGRYLFNSPVPGTIVTVANYYMVIIVFIAIGVAEEKRAHISVEFLTDLMPAGVQKAFALLAGVLTVWVATILMIGGYGEAMKKTISGAKMEQGSRMVEVWQSYWLVPIGAGLMALIAAYRIVTMVTGARNGLNETDPNVTFINE